VIVANCRVVITWWQRGRVLLLLLIRCWVDSWPLLCGVVSWWTCWYASSHMLRHCIATDTHDDWACERSVRGVEPKSSNSTCSICCGFVNTSTTNQSGVWAKTEPSEGKIGWAGTEQWTGAAENDWVGAESGAKSGLNWALRVRSNLMLYTERNNSTGRPSRIVSWVAQT